MKIKSFLALVMTSAILVACSNDDADDGGVVNNPQGKAWLSLTIKNPSSGGSGLRSLNSNNQDAGTADETDIKNVRAIFFDGTLDVVEDKALTLTEAGNPGQPSGSPGEAFEVDASAEHVMIVINPPASYPASWTVGTPFSTVNAAVEADVSTIISSTNGFMMTNAKGDLEPSLSDGTLTALTLYNTKANAENSPLTINVDRVVSKVRLYAATATHPGADVSDIGWALNVTNKKYYPLSKRTPTYLGTLTPFDLYGLGSYRIDPNYDHTAILYPSTDYDDNYNYFTTSSNPSFINPVDHVAPGSPQYCHENTQRKEDNNFAYTTQILVKAKYVPTSYRLADGSTTSVKGNNDDWMRINGAAYTFASLMTYITAELNSKYALADPSLYSTPRANALNNYLNAIGVGAVSIPNTPGTVAATIIAAFQAKKIPIETAINRAGTFGTFSYYAYGLNYYKIAIKHDDTGTDKNELGEFGVVRNSVYDVRITKFNNPGLPAIPDPDPTDPIDPADGSWLSVQIDINPWTWYVQEEEL